MPISIDLNDREHEKFRDNNGLVEVAITSSQIDGVLHTNTHTGNNELRIYSESNISQANSYSGSLGINQTFTGVWEDCTNYSEIIVTVTASQTSATNGLKIEWSIDGITKDNDDVFTISASSSKTFSFPCQTKYVRVVYINDGVAETNLRIQTLLKRFASKGSSHRLKDNLNQEDDAIVTKSQIVGFTTGGGGETDLINVKVNPSGALTVDVGATVLPTGAATSALQTTGNNYLQAIAGLVPSAYDYISLSYTGSNLTTVVYKTGGSGGTTVATLTLVYDVNDNLTSVTKS